VVFRKDFGRHSEAVHTVGLSTLPNLSKLEIKVVIHKSTTSTAKNYRLEAIATCYDHSMEILWSTPEKFKQM